MSKWQDKTILLTGGSSGIGLAVLKHALSNGAKVSVLTRQLTPELSEMKTDSLHLYEGDITQRQSVADWVQSAANLFGSLNTLLHCAGVMYYMDSVKPDYGQMKAMVDINCRGFIHLILDVLPKLKEAHHAHWINITSDAGKQPFPGLAVYSGTKAFLEFTARAMRQELLSEQIKITNIQPGNVDTPLHARSTDKDALNKHSTINKGQYLGVNDIVEAIDYAITTPHKVAVNEILLEPLTESII